MSCIAISIPIITYLVVIIPACYFITFFLIVVGFLKKSPGGNYSEHSKLRISIIIAARNEEKNIHKLLTDLKVQTYPEDLFDIIIVDDHSDHKIASLQEIKDLNIKNLKIIDLPESVFGKKAALQLAVENSLSELLLFTDADCRVGTDWLMIFARKYYQVKPSLIIGMIDYKKQKGFFKSFFRQEFISLIISGIGTANLGYPTLCNGANMAVKRDIYLKVAHQLQNSNPSGDDVFLLHRLKRNKEKIVALKERKSLVSTTAPETLSEFFNQRARWTSKAILYNDLATIYLALLVAITNLIFIFSIIGLINNGFSTAYVASVAFKIITDYTVIIVGLYFFNDKRTLIWLPLFQLFYPVYLIISLFMGIFKLYSWKGRKY